jgi:ABC-2 type transport system ATP-binding protein
MLIMSQGASLAVGTPGQIRKLARTKDNPDPTIEDAFVALATGKITPDTSTGTAPKEGRP